MPKFSRKFTRTVSAGSTCYQASFRSLRAEVLNFPGTRTIMAEVRSLEQGIPGFPDGLMLWSESFMRPDYTVSQVKDETMRQFCALAEKLPKE